MSRVSSAQSVAVIGAGVFGASAAIELRGRGFRVRLVEWGTPPHPAASSTDISKVVRVDYGDDDHYVDLAARALAAWRQWNRDGRPALYHEVGILMLSREGIRHGGFEADSSASLESRAIAVERLDASELGRRFPAWAGTAYIDGYFNPAAGWAASAEVVARMISDARRDGVELIADAGPSRLLEDGSRVVGVVLEDGTPIRSDTVVVAAGAWTPRLLPYLGDRMWATGQPVVHFRPADPNPFDPSRFPVWCADIANTGWYGFPVTRDGLLKVGHHGRGIRIGDDTPLEVPPAQRDRCVEFVEHTFEVLRGASIASTRLCLYCDTFDGDFWIDRDPDRAGLVVAAGGSGHGFKFAPVIGPIIADVVEGRPNAAASRFAWREAGQRRFEGARPVDS